MAKYVIDSFSPLDPAAVKRAGYQGQFRYVAPDNPKTRPKIITLPQAIQIRNQGLDLVLNFEWYETRPLDGFLAGQQDAITANVVAKNVGYPTTAAIYFSVDFGPTAAQLPKILDYFRGVNTMSKHPVGIYSGTLAGHPVLDAGLAKFFWQANAASWSGTTYSKMKANPSPRAHVRQHIHADTPMPIPPYHNDQFDPNTVLKADYGQWGSNVTPEPEKGMPDMFMLRNKVDGGIFVVGPYGKRHINDMDEVNIYTLGMAWAGATGATPIDVEPKFLDTIPDYVVPTGGSTPINLDVLARKVADELAARLKS